MCLEAQNMHRVRILSKTLKWHPKVAKNDIEVWKVLRSKCYGYETPYYGMKIKFHDGECSLISERMADVSETGQVKGGFFHSFTTKREADWAIYLEKYSNLFIDNTYGTDCVICRALIPKGSLVYYGKDEDIASNKLIIYDPKFDTLPQKEELL